jgi:hypothetical protein
MLIGFVDVELQSVTAYPQRNGVSAVDETLRQRSNTSPGRQKPQIWLSSA